MKMAKQFTFKTFSVDSNLMYLIQKVSGHTTEQILSYFYSMAHGVSENYMKKKRLANAINKTLQWHYQGFDCIPYKLNVYSHWNRGGHENETTVGLYVTVNFPKNSSNIDVAEVLNTIVESSIGLDGSQSMEPFPRPMTKVPAGFKKFIHE